MPAHERLSSDLRAIHIDMDRHTSFAWLGHGAIIPQVRAIDFLSLMNCLNATDDELKMADNYFTILSNTFVETWFDQGVELGGGQPFTVGSEGDERNMRHIVCSSLTFNSPLEQLHVQARAIQMLESTLTHPDASCLDSKDGAIPYVQKRRQPQPASVHRAPCLGSICLLETSIDLLPDTIKHSTSTLGQMLAHEAANILLLGEDRKAHYLSHPPSYAVDGDPKTAFCSFESRSQVIIVIDDG